MFPADRRYIDDVLPATTTAATDADATAQMVEKYPEHANRDFLLMMSIANLRAQK